MAKTARKKTEEELRLLSQKALEDQKLREIVQNAPKKGDGHINLTGVYNAAFEHVYGQTKDLKKAKELAVASRWAAKLKDEYPLDFKDKMAEIIEDNIVKTLRERAESKPELKPEPKEYFWEMRFEIPPVAVLISEENGWNKERFLKFPFLNRVEGSLDDHFGYINDFCMQILDTLMESVPETRTSGLREKFIKILEEKFGMTIKTCISCKHFSVKKSRFGYLCTHCSVIGGLDYQLDSYMETVFFSRFCKESSNEDKWASKEILEEKKEEEKECGNCMSYNYNMRICRFVNSKFCGKNRNFKDEACENWKKTLCQIPKEIPEETPRLCSGQESKN